MSARTVSMAVAVLATLGAAQAQGPLGTVRTIADAVLHGRLTVDENGAAIVSADAGATRLEVAELMSFEREGAEQRHVEVQDRVWLRSGLELPARRILGVAGAGGAQPTLVAELPSGIAVSLPLSALRALRHGGTARPQPTLFPEDLAAPPANDDLIYVVKDGQTSRSAVTVTGFTQDRVDFRLRGEPYDFGLDGLAGVVFGVNTGFAPDRQPRPRTVVELTTGEQLEGRLLAVDTTVRCRLDEGAVVTVPLDKLYRLRVSSDRLVWLTELAPAVEQTPAFDRVWPWLIDRSNAGPGFELGGRHFDRGIGMVPRTRLTYDLGGRFDVFEAVIGIDDRGGPEAHAVFRVFVDGEQRFESAPMTRGKAPEPLRIPLERARSLALEVDFGKNYDLGDFCAFAAARVVQQ